VSDAAEMERRLSRLEDLEAIKRLKAKYWNSVDRHEWDKLAECLTEDCSFETPMMAPMQGRDFIVRVLKRAMRTVTTAHQGHNPEIEIESDGAAHGRWALNDLVRTPEGGLLKGYGHYEEQYVKQDGAWKIRSSRLTYLFQAKESL
jgi:ketosteroid isomerase-like protein